MNGNYDQITYDLKPIYFWPLRSFKFQFAEHQEAFLELQELYKTLEVKSAKMEQLIRLKDAKISALTAKLQSAGLL